VRLTGLVLGGMVVVIILTGIVLLTVYQDRIYPRVMAGSVTVGNATPVEAAAKITSTFQATTQQPLTFTTKDRTWQVMPALLDPKIDVPATIAKAQAYGRTGTLSQRWRALKVLFIHGVTVIPVVTVNSQKVTDQLAEITQEAEVVPQSSRIDYIDGQFVAAPSVEGRQIDRQAHQEAVLQQLQTLDRRPLQVPTTVIRPPFTADQAQQLIPALQRYMQDPLMLTYGGKKVQMDAQTILTLLDYNQPTQQGIPLSQQKLADYIANFAQGIDQTPRDALFSFADGKVTAFAPAQEGITIDQEALVNKIAIALSDERVSHTIDVPVKKVEPNVAIGDVNNIGIKDLLAHGESNYRGSPSDRIFNIKQAMSHLNGVLIPPDGEFSFNNTVGEISQAAGYKQALVILSGKTVLGDGGGVCQVSTTVFRAALKAGLPITQRTAHAYRVGYYENDMGPGFDATIYQPGVDFRFKNDTGHYVLLQATVDEANTKLYIDLYGTSDGRVATLSSAKVLSQTPAPPDIHQDDPTLPKGQVKQVEHSIPGAKTVFTRTVQRNGQIFSQLQVREEPVTIEDNCNPAIFRRRASDFAIVDENRTSVGAIQSCDDA